jgi:hypothetical protein
MDRFDEKKDETQQDRIEKDAADREREEPAREGDILGLGGVVVPKSPGDPSAANDPDAAAQRRARMREDEASDAARREGGSLDNFGSASTDMGAGGRGNTIKPK